MEKYHRSDIVGIERENERDENYISKSNPQIHSEKTPYNFHFIKPKSSYTSFINQRLKDLAPKRKVKDDAVLISSFFVGASPEFFTDMSQEDIGAFFFECTEFFAERYGRENVISAVVHLDETTPHLHLNLMPILEGRPCAKKLFDKKALTSLQTELHKEVGKHWGLERGQEGSTAEHLDTVAFKLKKMKEAAKEAEQRADTAEERKIIAEENTSAAEQRRALAEEHTVSLERQREQLTREVAPLQAAADVLQEYTAGKRKPNKKDIPILAAELAKTKSDLHYSIQDQCGLFQELQQAEKKNAELQQNADFLRELKQLAPDKLSETIETVKERKKAKYTSSPLHSSARQRSK